MLPLFAFMRDTKLRTKKTQCKISQPGDVFSCKPVEDFTGYVKKGVHDH